MDLADQIKAVLIFGPIAFLLMVGAMLVVRSGAVGVGGGPDVRQMAGNASQAIVLVAACLLGLALLQRFIGFHSSLGGW